MTYETQQVILQGQHGGEVVGWVRPRLSEEEETAIRERLIQRRFEHVDEYLSRIDELLQELAELGALDTETVSAIREARVKVMKLHPTRPGSTTS
jgi:mevalonate kinase